MPANAWFIYALGSGWGHLNRAFALARVATRDRPIHLLVNSPYVSRIDALFSTKNLTLHVLPKTDSLADAKRVVQSKLESIDHDCLIVDTFPRGLIGELANFIPHKRDICRVFVHRDLTPDYIRAKRLDTFVAEHYDGILIPGESGSTFAHFPNAKITLPWLSRQSTELVSEPFSGWNISAQVPLVVVCATGQPDEQNFFGEIANELSTAFPHVTVRCLASSCPETCASALWIAHWPGIDVLQFADVVVGSGGYNLVSECAALKVPLVGFAMPRRYDRQARRIQQQACLVESVEDAIAAVRSLTQKRRNRRPAAYENGVLEAINHIDRWRSARRGTA